MSVKTITCKLGKVIPHPYIPFQNAKPEVEITLELQPNDNPEAAFAWGQGFVQHCLAEAEKAVREQFERERPANAMPHQGHTSPALIRGGAYAPVQSTHAPNAYGAGVPQAAPSGFAGAAPLPHSASRESAIEREAARLGAMERQDSLRPAQTQGAYPVQQGNGQGYGVSTQHAPAPAMSAPAPMPQGQYGGSAPNIYDTYPESQPNHAELEGPPAPIGNYQLIP